MAEADALATQLQLLVDADTRAWLSSPTLAEGQRPAQPFGRVNDWAILAPIWVASSVTALSCDWKYAT